MPRAASARVRRASERRQPVSNVGEGSEKEDAKLSLSRRTKRALPTSPSTSYEGNQSKQESSPNYSTRRSARSRASTPVSSHIQDVSGQELSLRKPIPKEQTRSRSTNVAQHGEGPPKQDSADDKESIPTRKSKRARRSPRPPGQQTLSPSLRRKIVDATEFTATALNQFLDARELQMKCTSDNDDAFLQDGILTGNKADFLNCKPSSPLGSDVANWNSGAKTEKFMTFSDEISHSDTCPPADVKQIEGFSFELESAGNVMHNETSENDEVDESATKSPLHQDLLSMKIPSKPATENLRNCMESVQMVGRFSLPDNELDSNAIPPNKSTANRPYSAEKSSSLMDVTLTCKADVKPKNTSKQQIDVRKLSIATPEAESLSQGFATSDPTCRPINSTVLSLIHQTQYDTVVQNKADCFPEELAVEDNISLGNFFRDQTLLLQVDKVGEFTVSGLALKAVSHISAVSNINKTENLLPTLAATLEDSVEKTHVVKSSATERISNRGNSDAKTIQINDILTGFPSAENVIDSKEPIEVDGAETGGTDSEITANDSRSKNGIAMEIDDSTIKGNSGAKEVFEKDLMNVEHLVAMQSLSEATYGDYKSTDSNECTATNFFHEEMLRGLGTQSTNVHKIARAVGINGIDFQLAGRSNYQQKSGGPKNGEVHNIDSSRILSKNESEQDRTKLESESTAIDLKKSMVAFDDVERKNLHENMFSEESAVDAKISTVSEPVLSDLASGINPGPFDRKSSWIANVNFPKADEFAVGGENESDDDKKVETPAAEKVSDVETRDIHSNKTDSSSNGDIFFRPRTNIVEKTPLTTTAIVYSNTKDADTDCRIVPVIADLLCSHPQLPSKQDQLHPHDEINDHDPNVTEGEKSKFKIPEAKRESRTEKGDLITTELKADKDSCKSEDSSMTQSAFNETRYIDTAILGQGSLEEADSEASTVLMVHSSSSRSARTSSLVANSGTIVKDSAASELPNYSLWDDKTTNDRLTMSKNPRQSAISEIENVKLVKTKNLYLISKSEMSRTVTSISNADLECVIASADVAYSSKAKSLTDLFMPVKSLIDHSSSEVWLHADNIPTEAKYKNSALETVHAASDDTYAPEAKTLTDLFTPAKLSVDLSSNEVHVASSDLSMAVPIVAAPRSTRFDTSRTVNAESAVMAPWAYSAGINVSGDERQPLKHDSAIEINSENDQNGSTPSLISVECTLNWPLMPNVMTVAQSANLDSLPKEKSAKVENLEDYVEGLEMQYENLGLEITIGQDAGPMSNKTSLTENQERISTWTDKHVSEAAPDIYLPTVGEVKRVEVDVVEIAPPSYLDVDKFSPYTICLESVPQLNLRKCKIKIFTAAVRVYRGQGVERLFALYWYNLSCYVHPKLAIGSREWKKARDEINSFLATKKLRRLHNALILGIMQLTSHSRSPAYSVQDLPPRWKHRDVKWHRLGDRDMLEETFTDHWMSMFTCRNGTWSSRTSSESLGTIERSRLLDLSLNRNRRLTDHSSCLPGALAIDPVVRFMVEEGGLKVSENAIWLLVVAVREYVATTLKKTITRSKSISESQLLAFSVPDTIDLFPKRKYKDKKSTATPCVLQANSNPKPRGCITSLDIASVLCARPSYSPIGGLESHLAYERCIQSSYVQVHTTSQAECDLVCQYIFSSIENRGKSKRQVAAVSRNDDSKNAIFIPPVFESSNLSLKITKDDTALHQASPPYQPHVSRSHAMRRSPGMGRGAKDLAALKARASTGTEATKDSSPTLDVRKAATPEPPVLPHESSSIHNANSSIASSLPLVFVAPTQQVRKQVLILPQYIAHVETQSQVFPMIPKPSVPTLAKHDEGPMTSQPLVLPVLQASKSQIPLPVTECLEDVSTCNEELNSSNSSPPRGIGGARGRGFGVKNLAAMRARSSSDKEESSTPPPGGNDSEQLGNPVETSKLAAVSENNAQSPCENGGNQVGKLHYDDSSNRNSDELLTLSISNTSELESEINHEEAAQYATTAL